MEGLEEKADTEAVEAGEDGAAELAEKGPEAKVVEGEEGEEGEASLMDLISGGVYSKSYKEAQDALKNAAALNTGRKWNSKMGKKGRK